MFRSVSRALAIVAVAATAAGAQVVIPSTTLQTMPAVGTSHTYTGLDVAGTSLTVSTPDGGWLSPIYGTWPGLWFGGHNQSGTYVFTFDRPITSFSMYVTAISTGNGFSETFNAFAVNGGTPTYGYTNVQYTAFDGTDITASQDDGRFRFDVSVGAGQSFTSFSFYHAQTGRPSGSVFEELQYTLASRQVVPEPSTYALFGAGLLALGVVARRHRAA